MNDVAVDPTEWTLHPTAAERQRHWEWLVARQAEIDHRLLSTYEALRDLIRPDRSDHWIVQTPNGITLALVQGGQRVMVDFNVDHSGKSPFLAFALNVSQKLRSCAGRINFQRVGSPAEAVERVSGILAALRF